MSSRTTLSNKSPASMSSTTSAAKQSASSPPVYDRNNAPSISASPSSPIPGTTATASASAAATDTGAGASAKSINTSRSTLTASPNRSTSSSSSDGTDLSKKGKDLLQVGFTNSSSSINPPSPKFVDDEIIENNFQAQQPKQAKRQSISQKKYDPNAPRVPIKPIISPPGGSGRSSISNAAAFAASTNGGTFSADGSKKYSSQKSTGSTNQSTTSEQRKPKRRSTMLGFTVEEFDDDDKLSEDGTNPSPLSEMPGGVARNPVDNMLVTPKPIETLAGLNFINLRLWRGGFPVAAASSAAEVDAFTPDNRIDQQMKIETTASTNLERRKSLNVTASASAPPPSTAPVKRPSFVQRLRGLSVQDDVDFSTDYSLFNRDWACVLSVRGSKTFFQTRHSEVSFHLGSSSLVNKDCIASLIPKKSFTNSLQHYVLKRAADGGSVYIFRKEKVRDHSVFFIYEGADSINPENCRYFLHWNKSGKATLRARSKFRIRTTKSSTEDRHVVIGKDGELIKQEEDNYPKYPSIRLFDTTIAEMVSVIQPANIRVATYVDVVLVLAAFIIADRYMTKTSKFGNIVDEDAKKMILESHFSAGVGSGLITDLLY